MKHYPPVGEAAGKKRQVERMFDAIAPRYDLLNRVLSLGVDTLWRREAVDWLAAALEGEGRPRRILDVATGTADLALEALRLEPDEVVGVDIAEEMLRIGREKVAERGAQDVVALQRADSENLPFEEDRFDGLLVAFGVRNFEDLDRGLREFRRVLRPGGTAVVLEFSRPTVFPIKQLFTLYFRFVLPLIGRLVSKDEGAYEYLPASVAVFPDGPDFLARMHRAGFHDLHWQPLTFGIASLYRGRVPERRIRRANDEG